MKKKRLVLAGLLAVLMASVAYGALLTYYGRISATIDVQQSVLVDGNPWDVPIVETFGAVGGDTVCTYHWLESRASVTAPINFVVSIDPWVKSGAITTTYTTTITEAPKTEAEYGDLCHQLVALPVDGLTLSELLDLDLEYTVNVIVNTGALYGYGYAPNINMWITDGTDTYVVENWGGGWPDETVGLKTQTWEALMASSGGVTLRDYLGQPWGEISIGYTAYTDTASLTADYGEWTVTEVEVRAQGGASAGQVIRPTQFVVAGRTINLPNVNSFTTIDLPPGVILKFAICYEFNVALVGTYTIETQVQPA